MRGCVGGWLDGLEPVDCSALVAILALKASMALKVILALKAIMALMAL